MEIDTENPPLASAMQALRVEQIARDGVAFSPDGFISALVDCFAEQAPQLLDELDRQLREKRRNSPGMR